MNVFLLILLTVGLIVLGARLAMKLDAYLTYGPRGLRGRWGTLLFVAFGFSWGSLTVRVIMELAGALK